MRKRSKKLLEDAAKRVKPVAKGSKKAIVSASVSVAGLLTTTQGLLASTLATDINAVLARITEGSATIYDKAMDAGYLATNIGGGNHRLFDGGHTIAGALESVRGAAPDDSIIQEGLGYVQGMFRDLSDLFDRRRRLMNDWEAYLAGTHAQRPPIIEPAEHGPAGTTAP